MTRLPDDEARRVLERAAEHDAALRSGTTVEQLRQAAIEAGISEAAFDIALAESRRPSAPITTPVWPRFARTVAFWVFVILIPISFLQITRRPQQVSRPALGVVPRRACPQLNSRAMRMLGRRFHPDAFPDGEQKPATTIAFLLNDHCDVIAHAMSPNSPRMLATDAIMRSLFAAQIGRGVQYQSGYTDEVNPTGDAFVVWAIYRSPEQR